MTKVGKERVDFIFSTLESFCFKFHNVILSPYSFSVINSSQCLFHFHNISHKTLCAPSDYVGLVLVIPSYTDSYPVPHHIKAGSDSHIHLKPLIMKSVQNGVPLINVHNSLMSVLCGSSASLLSNPMHEVPVHIS